MVLMFIQLGPNEALSTEVFSVKGKYHEIIYSEGEKQLTVEVEAG